MSRIREALTKIEGGARPTPSPAPVAMSVPVAVPPPVAMPATVAPPRAGVTSLPGLSLPEIPAEFHRELAGLRFTLETALEGRATRVVQFAGAVAGEGTTTVVCSFARVLAQDPNVHVLVVDANVRRPGVDLFFGLSATAGLRELADAGLADQAERYVQAVERPNLHVLPAVPMQGEPSRLFSAEAVRNFWMRFGCRYQWVLIDAPPVLEAAETSVLGSTVDTTVLIVQAARTKRGVVQRALERCAKAGAPVLGAVLNRRRLDIPEFIYRRI
jgi:Mrp family chromosome partitioning ATPase